MLTQLEAQSSFTLAIRPTTCKQKKSVSLENTIQELMALELYFEEGRRRCHKLRKELEQSLAPARSEDEQKVEENAKLIQILNKRKNQFSKTAQKKRA